MSLKTHFNSCSKPFCWFVASLNQCSLARESKHFVNRFSRRMIRRKFFSLLKARHQSVKLNLCDDSTLSERMLYWSSKRNYKLIKSIYWAMKVNAAWLRSRGWSLDLCFLSRSAFFSVFGYETQEFHFLKAKRRSSPKSMELKQKRNDRHAMGNFHSNYS